MKRWLLSLLLLGCGCPSEAVAPTTDASTDHADADAIAEGGVVDVEPLSDGSTACSDEPTVPSGWTPYAAFCRGCGFSTPTSASDLPPVIQWEACPSASTVPQGVVCKAMKLDWPAINPGAPHLSGLMQISVEPAGPTIFFARLTTAAIIAMVARADGPVLQAMQVNPKRGCYVGPGSSLKNGNFMFTLTRYESDQAQQILGGGAVGGAQVAPPTLHLSGATELAVEIGATLYLDVGPYQMRRLSNDTLVDTLQVPAFKTAHHSFYGDVLLYDEFNATTNAVGFRTPDAALHDVANFGSDVTQGASNLVTDGVDFVWLEAYGRPTKNDPWAGARLMTAKYTTNTASLVARRVRSWSPERFTATNFSVGCGYAIGNVVDGGVNVGVRIVRLSDGVSWKLVGPNNSKELRWSNALGITCDEAFAYVDVGTERNIARVRLDSLGTGDAAD